MQRLKIADPDIMRIAIQQEVVRSEKARYDHRLHGLPLITAEDTGRTNPSVASAPDPAPIPA